MLNRSLKFGLILLCTQPMMAIEINYDVQAFASTGFGDNLPFHLRSLKQGLWGVDINQGLIRAGINKKINYDKKFDYGFGVDLVGAYNNSENIFAQELYGELKYGWFDLLLGSKESYGYLKNRNLSSGGLIWSGNARPLPQLKLSLDRFRTIPRTNGWLQIYGDVAYGYFIDSPWLRDNFNYQNSFITTNVWYHHKSLFFRSKESKKFVFTLGIEFGTQFSGDYTRYVDGEIDRIYDAGLKFTDFLRVLIPSSGGSHSSGGDQMYYYGNHLGSWHILGEYKLNKTQSLKAYTEWIFEDGSGIGKMNGWDGLWGLEYKNDNPRSIVRGAVFEYLDTRNQGGPIHWAPNDHPDTEIKDPATGADDYYNNYYYDGWAHFGNANGNPLLVGPVYNQDGYLRFKNTRVRAFHVAVEGNISNSISYIARYTNNKAWGTPYVPRKEQKANSFGLDINYKPKKLSGWTFGGAIGGDTGSLYGENVGVQFSICKTGLLN